MKCPNYGSMVYADDTLDTEWVLGKYYDTVEGTCQDCGVSWRWIEVYPFEREMNIEQIDPNDHP